MSLYKDGPLRNKLIALIRFETDIPKSIVPDEELIKKTEGSFMFARLEMGMALKEFKDGLKEIIFNKK